MRIVVYKKGTVIPLIKKGDAITCFLQAVGWYNGYGHMQISQISDFGPVQSFFRLDTDLKKRRYTGIVVVLVLLIIFLGFNRFP